jgi:hypothetical protein
LDALDARFALQAFGTLWTFSPDSAFAIRTLRPFFALWTLYALRTLRADLALAALRPLWTCRTLHAFWAKRTFRTFRASGTGRTHRTLVDDLDQLGYLFFDYERVGHCVTLGST